MLFCVLCNVISIFPIFLSPKMSDTDDNQPGPSTKDTSPRKLSRKLSLNTEQHGSNKKKKLPFPHFDNFIDNLGTKGFLDFKSIALITKAWDDRFLHELSPSDEKLDWKALRGKYSRALQHFLLTFNIYSPEGYEHTKECYDIFLPDSDIIRKWFLTKTDKKMTGFTEKSFEILEKKAKSTKSEIVVALMVEENLDDFLLGSHDMGSSLEEPNDEAESVLIFMVNCINGSWRLPVGLFYAEYCTRGTKLHLMHFFIKNLHDIGIRVAVVTFGYVNNNSKIAKKLGCCMEVDNLKTYFEHPISGKKIYVSFELGRTIQLIRALLKTNRVFLHRDGDRIHWDYLTKLWKLDRDERSQLENKLMTNDVNILNHSIELMSQYDIFNGTVADILDCCMNFMKLEKFAAADATVRFIRLISNICDIFNSKNMKRDDYNKPVSVENLESVYNYLDEAQNYISRIHIDMCMAYKNNGLKIVIFCLQSSKDMIKEFVETEQIVQNFPLYKVNLDNIKYIFESAKYDPMYVNNPSKVSIEKVYNAMLDTFPAVNVNIGFKHSAVKTINLSITPFKSCYMNEENFSQVTSNDLHFTIFKEYISETVTYISEMVTANLYSKLKCDYCIASLTCSIRDPLRKNLMFTKKIVLMAPSEDVTEICLKTEQLLRNSLKIKPKQKLTPTSKLKLVYDVLSHFSTKDVFSNLYVHQFDTHPEMNHAVFLIRAVAEEFLDIMNVLI